MTTKSQPGPSGLADDLFRIVAALDDQAHHTGWSPDAREHFHRAATHALGAVREVKRAEQGVSKEQFV